MAEVAILGFDTITVGDVFQFEKEITRDDVVAFADLTGDHNPLHVNEEFGKKSQFKRNIVHGMLAGSLFSTLVGMHCPGEKSLYMSQSLNFRLPIYYDDKVTVRGTVVDKTDSIKLITLKTEIIKEDKVAINVEAKVKVMGD